LKVNLDVRILLHEHLDALVHPRALLRIVEGPEADVDGLLGLGKRAPPKRCGRRRAKACHTDPANDIASRRTSSCKLPHRFLPKFAVELLSFLLDCRALLSVLHSLSARH